MQLLFLLVAPVLGNLVPSSVIQIPPRILWQFLDYGLIIHYDDLTAKDVETLLVSKHRNHQPTFLLNYNKKDRLTDRPRGYKYLHVVFMRDPFDFEPYSAKDYNFRSTDVVLFIVDGNAMNIPDTRIWKMRGLDEAANILIYDYFSEEMFHCCYYCGNLTAVLRKISGAEGNLLQEMSRVHNFKFDLIEFKSEPGKGAWQSMIEAVEFKQVDWAVGGISVSLKRGIYTDLTRYIKTEGFAVLYATYVETWTIFEIFLLVYEWPVWASVLTVIFCISMVANSRNLGVYFKMGMMAIVEQPCQSRLLQANSARMAFLIWWLCSTSLTSVYKSRLASTSIIPFIKEPRKIDDLVDRGFIFQVDNFDATVLYENLISSSDKVYGEVLKKLRNDLDFCESVVAAGRGKVAVIQEETAIQYAIFKICNSLIPEDIQERLRLVSENIFPSTYHAWSMQMGAPYRLQFSKTIGRMDDYGLIHHWYKSATIYRLPRSHEQVPGGAATSLTLRQILPPLTFLLAGLFAAACAFFLEIYIK